MIANAWYSSSSTFWVAYKCDILLADLVPVGTTRCFSFPGASFCPRDRRVQRSSPWCLQPWVLDAYHCPLCWRQLASRPDPGPKHGLFHGIVFFLKKLTLVILTTKKWLITPNIWFCDLSFTVIYTFFFTRSATVVFKRCRYHSRSVDAFSRRIVGPPFFGGTSADVGGIWRYLTTTWMNKIKGSNHEGLSISRNWMWVKAVVCSRFFECSVSVSWSGMLMQNHLVPA